VTPKPHDLVHLSPLGPGAHQSHQHYHWAGDTFRPDQFRPVRTLLLFQDIWNPLARVLDVWGFDLCLWGTDWARAFAVVNYE
jgi:hypothetical protein